VEVVVSGEVGQAGAFLVAATHRVLDVLRAAGGITAQGSRRRVEVRTDAGLRVLDLLRFELGGDLGENPVVTERMRVHVPPRAGVVTLAGAFRRPGEYELGAEASLRELLELTGGLTEQAAARQARLTRVGPEGRRQTLAVDLTAVAPPADVRLRPGDELFVPPLAVIQDVVEVRGALLGTAEASRSTTAGKPTVVQRLTLARGERIADVLGRAGGVAPHADLRLAFVDRTGAGGPRQRIPVDLHRLLVDKDETQNILLENGDVVTVPVAEDKVYVLGEVRNPGPVDYRPELTPREYVALAGGPTVRARFREATVTFPSGRSYRLAEAPPLEPGAVVTVPEVAVRWYQDYLTIAQTLASIVTAYAGLWLIFRND
jgi:protein involved in polysaccharide export with SLBB domain